MLEQQTEQGNGPPPSAMGVVCDGSISGFLPKDDAFAVHYPGYPSSTSRAIETLGGKEGILKARSSVSNYLELHFRPEDPYSHPAFGELRHCKGLLLRLSTNRPANAQTADPAKDLSESMEAEVTNLEQVNERRNTGKTPIVSETEFATTNVDKHPRHDEPSVSSQLCADIVARVVNAYHFDGMVDYQHILPIHANIAKRKKRHLVQSQFDKDGFMDIDQDLMMLVPPLFSQKDIPENLVLRPLGSENSKLKQERAMQHHWEMDIGPCFALDFDIKDIPGPINCIEKISKYSADWDWLSAIIDLFNERPIWPRCSLHARFLEKGLKVSNDQMKRLLLRSAYYFATGPFRGFWIRKGYDPRKDSESRIYQSIEFRVPKELRSFEITGADGEGKQTLKDMCAFRVFPSKSFSSLQLYELDDDYIQQEIRKPTKQNSCNRWTGWFSRSRFRRLRLSVHIRFLSIHPSPEAKNLLKEVSKRLENCKKLENLEDGLSDDEDFQPADGDPKGDTMGLKELTGDMDLIYGDDKGELGDEEAEEEEEEEDEEEEEEEEEYNADGSLVMGGHHGGASLSQHPYMGAAAHAANYFQELLSGFPFDVGGEDHHTGNGVRIDDTSDHEYEIYEQDSDDEQ